MTAPTVTRSANLPPVLLCERRAVTLDEAEAWGREMGAGTVYFTPWAFSKRGHGVAYIEVEEVKQPHPASLEEWTAEDILRREG